MRFQVSEKDKQAARWGHELYLINILLFHLLLTPASIALDIGWYGLLLPLLPSSVVITITYLKGQGVNGWFATCHWRLAFHRYRLLLLGYLLTGALFVIAYLITLGVEQPSMQAIVFTIAGRFAVMPTLIMAMITAVLEASAFSLVGNGEVPDWLIKQCPGQPVVAPIVAGESVVERESALKD